jgi:hypothetical protein
MKQVPSYPKVLTLGSAYTERALVGDVFLQEKVDGSQFGFGVNENGELVARTHHTHIEFAQVPKLFMEAVHYLAEIKDVILSYPPDTYFYCEYLWKPKHNTLSYQRIPKNHLVLFDAIINGNWATRDVLEDMAVKLDIDIIPQYYVGQAGVDTIKQYLEMESFLGGEKVEGVVIKNYNQTVLLGPNVFPLFTKYVQEGFKERNSKEWNKDKDTLKEFINSFNAEARWQKAINHAREEGVLTNTPRDIGELIKRINLDILEEETDNIKDFLFKHFWKEISRVATRGFAEWYKNKLLERLEEPEVVSVSFYDDDGEIQ